jgi:hypothetical protein
MLVATVSHFLELKSELEFLRSRCNADLTEDEVDALQTWVCVASDSLLSYVPSLVAHGPPDGTGIVAVVACVVNLLLFCKYERSE